ncbi:hypothetical protein GJS40_14295 [Aliibacillus thermotolerans]|nr:hypothetical protein [Aliibacillus thermotolerans]
MGSSCRRKINGSFTKNRTLLFLQYSSVTNDVSISGSKRTKFFPSIHTYTRTIDTNSPRTRPKGSRETTAEN